MNDGTPYHFGFLDFALNETISIPYSESYRTQVTWDPTASDYQSGTITENNIMVIAAIYNQDSVKKYANPPFQNPFQAHYIDATAAATTDTQGFNKKHGEYTHTGLIEEATATWCPYCPAMGHAIYNVYADGELPFYFISLISDRSDNAAVYLQNNYNLYAYPSAFMDGGDNVIVGGYDNEDFYINRLNRVLTRDVHDLNLSISLVYNQDSTLVITVNITNNEIIPNTPPTTPVITGKTKGKKGTEYQYSIVAVDQEDNNLYYRIDWGDGEITDWLGPHEPDTAVVVNHSWEERGDYEIRVQAKDIYDAESEWGTLSISMPILKSIERNHPLQFLIQLFQEFIQKISIQDNTPPNPPDITGPTTGKINEPQNYIFVLTDPDEDQLLRIEIDFGDESLLERCGCDKPWFNGTVVDFNHIWKEEGTYQVTARVQDEFNAWSDWSNPLTVTMPRIKDDKEPLISLIEK